MDMRNLFVILILMTFTGITSYGNSINTNAIQEEKITSNSPSIKYLPDGIELNVSDNNTYQFGIYTITGHLIRSVKVTPQTSITINLPQGFYIVKCEKWVKQIVIK